MRIAVVSLFPQMIREALKIGVVGRALERGVFQVECFDPRDYTSDPHRTVDDRPFGGGPGMVMKVEPVRSANLRATLLDRLGRTDEAFHWFDEANRLHAADPGDPLKHAAAYRDTLRDEIATMNPAWVASWQDTDPAPARPDPVFLVGFPRSGTTLLDTILMGHPGAVVMEEQPRRSSERQGPTNRTSG